MFQFFQKSNFTTFSKARFKQIADKHSLGLPHLKSFASLTLYQVTNEYLLKDRWYKPKNYPDVTSLFSKFSQEVCLCSDSLAFDVDSTRMRQLERTKTLIENKNEKKFWSCSTG